MEDQRTHQRAILGVHRQKTERWRKYISGGGASGIRRPTRGHSSSPEWVIGMDMLRSGQNPPFGSLRGGVEASSEGRWSGGP